MLRAGSRGQRRMRAASPWRVSTGVFYLPGWVGGGNQRQLTRGRWNDGRHVLVHGQLLGSTLTRLYLVDVGSGDVEPVSVPGFRTCGHGSWDLTETVMAFDGQRGPASSEAADR